MKKSQYVISADVIPGSVIVTYGVAGILVEGKGIDGYHVRVLWDTGATTSAVSEKIVAQLKPKFLRQHSVDTAHGGPTVLASYSNITFMLADGLAFTPQSTDAVNLEGQPIDAVIGMDIISLGTFLLERKPDGLMRFTFSVNA